MTQPRDRDISAPATPARAPEPAARRGPVRLLLGLFSSVWLGVTLLTLLFLYSSVGSAGLPIGPGIREYPFFLRPDAWVSVREVFELSEFQWFHWWPFDVLIGLICLNIVVTTLRRIPFNVVNLGVWTIHTGILVLAAGSVWYFGTKVEGDAPVARRRVVARIAGHEPVSMVAAPGNQIMVGEGPDAYSMRVMSVTPEWELLSGDDKGTRAYKVSVIVDGGGQTFIRELIDGFPQYTEDLVRSDDPQQPFARAKKTLGTAIVDDAIDLGLDYYRQPYFYVMETTAIYLREQGAEEWIERPISGLPRFKDYVSSYDAVWGGGGPTLPPLRPLDVAVAGDDPRDPLPGVDLRITDHLRYALMETHRMPGGDVLDPAVSFRLRNPAGQTQDLQLVAFDPVNRSLGNGAIELRWISQEDQLDDLRAARPSILHIEVPAAGVTLHAPITALAGDDDTAAFTPIDGTEYAYRVRSNQDGLVIRGESLSVAFVEIRRGDTTFERWVFDDPAFTGDQPPDGAGGEHAPGQLIDDGIRMEYVPGQQAGVRLVAGPEEETLRMLLPRADGGVDELTLERGVPVEIRDGIDLTVLSYVARSSVQRRPRIIPPEQRNRDVGVMASMVRVTLPDGPAAITRWLPYHIYPFDRPSERVGPRFPYEPTAVRLADGRTIELMFSRERQLLPAPVVLDDFRLKTHIGGYAGTNTSVRDWTSAVRFEVDGQLTDEKLVSVNAPKEQSSFWFFQSQWDPPTAARGPNDPGSPGLNYTVLGVGNRRGVLVQLLGCCIAVLGMIYAFYVKPTIKRRRQTAAYAAVAARGRDRAHGGRPATPEPALAIGAANGQPARAATPAPSADTHADTEDAS